MGSDLFFENKKYIPAKDAASLTGYSKDYIGQLCRGNKVLAKRIGHTWYVSEESIIEYKNTPTDFDFARNLRVKAPLTNSTIPTVVDEKIENVVVNNEIVSHKEDVSTPTSVISEVRKTEQFNSIVTTQKSISSEIFDESEARIISETIGIKNSKKISSP